MRRRQILAMRQAQQQPVQHPVEVAKGACPKCQKHIGKGIAFHIKGCKS
jgi:hypothetical protein